MEIVSVYAGKCFLRGVPDAAVCHGVFFALILLYLVRNVMEGKAVGKECRKGAITL